MKGKIAFLFGLLSLAATPLWLLVVAPLFLQLPADFQFTADIISTDNFYDAERNAYAGAIYSKAHFFYETVEQEPSSLLVRNTIDVRTPEDEPIFSVKRLYGIDRKTKAHIPRLGDREREGYLFAPRHLKKEEPFIYWHINYDGPAQMQFVKEEKLFGLRVFRYETRYEGVSIDQTENLGHLPSVGETLGVELEPYLQLWIEPYTGRLIKYKDNTIAYYYNLQTGERLHPWNHFSNTFEKRSVEHNVTLARIAKLKEKVVELYVPLLLLLCSLFFIIKILYVRNGRRLPMTKRIFQLLCGWSTISVALISLFGWIIHSESLMRIVPVGSAMNPLTGVCLVVLGSMVLLTVKNHITVAKYFGMTVMIVGLLRLLEYAGALPLQIDTLLFRELVTTAKIPSRMSAYTALSFFLLGSAPLTAFPRVQKLRLMEVFPTIVLFFSSGTLITYLFDAQQLVAIPLFFSSAFHTAVLFLLLSIAVYLLYSKRDDNLTFRAWLITSGVLTFFVFFTLIFVGSVESNFTKSAQGLFDRKVDNAVGAINDRIGIYINALQAGVGFFNASQRVERDEWKTYVNAIQLQENYPGIQGMGYATFVQPEEYDEHIAAVRSEGFPNFTIRPPGTRELYTSIIYLEPFDSRNKQAFGFDMFQEPVRRIAMEQARDTGMPHMSGRITLVQEIDDDVQPGFLIYVPHYANGQPHKTLEEKRASIVGYVYAPFRMRNFVEGTVDTDDLEDIALRIIDGVDSSTENELYNDAKNKLGDENVSSRFAITKTLYVAGRPWTLQFRSTKDFGVTSRNNVSSLIILLAGIAISSLFAAFYYILVTSRQKAVAYAHSMTQDLQTAKAKDESILVALNKAALVSITNLEGNITFANDALLSISQYSKEELIGKGHRILLSDDQPNTLFPDLWKKVSSGSTWRGEIKDQAKDGSIFWVDATVSPILGEDGKPKEYMTISFLVTEKKEAEQKLQETLKDVQKFQLAVESSKDAIAMADTDMRYVYVNPAWEKLTGYSKEEVLDKTPHTRLQPGFDPFAVDRAFEWVMSGDVFHTEDFIFQRKNGQEYDAEVLMYPLLDEQTQKPFLHVIIHHDITRRKRVDTAKGEFVSLASHQLRTPLTALRWGINLLLKQADKLTVRERELLGDMHLSAQRMSETIRTMLQLSHIEAGKVQPIPSAVNLKPLFEEIANEQKEETTIKSQSVSIECLAKLTVDTDEDLLREVVRNLVSNAVKYTPNDGTVTISAKKEDEHLKIDVTDTGYGIPSHQQEKIFTKFFRADNIVDKEAGGTGLGLYLVYSLAKVLGGNITFISQENKGTTFSLTLPLSLSDHG